MNDGKGVAVVGFTNSMGDQQSKQTRCTSQGKLQHTRFNRPQRFVPFLCRSLDKNTQPLCVIAVPEPTRHENHPRPSAANGMLASWCRACVGEETHPVSVGVIQGLSNCKAKPTAIRCYYKQNECCMRNLSRTESLAQTCSQAGELVLGHGGRAFNRPDPTMGLQYLCVGHGLPPRRHLSVLGLNFSKAQRAVFGEKVGDYPPILAARLTGVQSIQGWCQEWVGG